MLSGMLLRQCRCARSRHPGFRKVACRAA